jgi:hypothetical protein
MPLNEFKIAYDNLIEKVKNFRTKNVIECKIFIRDLHLLESEGSLIDILSFMENDRKLRKLKHIFEQSKVQSNEYDYKILEKIYKEHLINASKINQARAYKHAIVQGAGPVGLYAAYKLFSGNKI